MGECGQQASAGSRRAAAADGWQQQQASSSSRREAAAGEQQQGHGAAAEGDSNWLGTKTGKRWQWWQVINESGKGETVKGGSRLGVGSRRSLQAAGSKYQSIACAHLEVLPAPTYHALSA